MTNNLTELSNVLASLIPDSDHLCVQIDYKLPNTIPINIIRNTLDNELVQQIANTLECDNSNIIRQSLDEFGNNVSSVRFLNIGHKIQVIKITCDSIWCQLGAGNITEMIEEYYHYLMKIIQYLRDKFDNNMQTIHRIGMRTNYDGYLQEENSRKQLMHKFVIWEDFVDVALIKKIKFLNHYDGQLQLLPLALNNKGYGIRIDLDLSLSKTEYQIIEEAKLKDCLLEMGRAFEVSEIKDLLLK